MSTRPIVDPCEDHSPWSPSITIGAVIDVVWYKGEKWVRGRVYGTKGDQGPLVLLKLGDDDSVRAVADRMEDCRRDLIDKVRARARA